MDSRAAGDEGRQDEERPGRDRARAMAPNTSRRRNARGGGGGREAAGRDAGGGCGRCEDGYGRGEQPRSPGGCAGLHSMHALCIYTTAPRELPLSLWGLNGAWAWAWAWARAWAWVRV